MHLVILNKKIYMSFFHLFFLHNTGELGGKEMLFKWEQPLANNFSGLEKTKCKIIPNEWKFSGM
jgi:hypothetical protein